METRTIVSVAFPVAIGLVMLGLGLALQVSDFTRILKAPAPVLIGLLSQVVAAPIIAFVLSKILQLPPELAIGLMILSASPSGAMANIFSRFSGGDVALGLTLTAIGTILSAVTLPLISGLAIHVFSGSSSAVDFQFAKSLEVVAVILIAVPLGMWVRVAYPKFGNALDRLLRVFSILVLALIIVAAASKEWATLTANIGQLGWIIALFNVANLAVGYFLPRFLKLPRNQAITISMGAGVHNATLSIFLALSVLGSTAYALPSAIYGVLMFFSAGALVPVFKRAKLT